MTRPVLERMAAVKAQMTAANGSSWRRTPKAFYLNQADLAEFIATDPPTIAATFRNSPSTERGFDGVPVRAAKGLTGASGASKLYSAAGTGIQVPGA
jgi:hypothetical protein